jgi:hypothetical protein
MKESDSKQMVWPADFRCHVVAGQHATSHCCAHTPAAQAIQVGTVQAICRTVWTWPLIDFHLFLHLRTFLSLPNFIGSEELKSVVEGWVNMQAAAFYDEGTQKLVPHYDQCFNSGSDYVEK